MRVAVYYAPAPGDPLWGAACTWLGRDAETGAAVRQPAVAGIAEMTAAPRVYGFHATLKPPMRLATAYDLFMADVERVAGALPPFDLPPLVVADVSGFLALQEAVKSGGLRATADACVVGLDAHRAPAGAEELARRRGGGLPAAQEAMLLQWGYPYVLDTWFFHMTLTRRLSAAEREWAMPAAAAHFEEVLAGPRRVEALTVFTQAGPGAPFLVAERVALRG